MKQAAAILVAGIAAPAAAQEAGWHYSPFPGEGDRAALGCAYGSSPASHACVAVRCEDDYTIGLYITTSRPGGDAGRWAIEVDGEKHAVTAAAVAGSPYGARIDGDTGALVEAIRNGGSLFLDPLEGAPLGRNGIGLSGSLRAINQALYFCAPRVAPEPPAQATE
ncbi:MAG TPA: hypothetical protein GYA10_16880 [Alphaproteobacteria bacterium]|nr:hypothetical protein [Alphaproteobacteria bacterium]